LPTTEKSRTGEFNVLAAGSLIRVKGFGLAVKAFKLFADKHPDSKLTIAGEGPEERRIRRLIHRSHLENVVQMVGAVPRRDLLSMMASSDALLFPSLRDGGGTVVIEAMSVAKPVICVDIGGPGLHITEDCGIKIAPTSSQETAQNLADALERLYLDEGLRTRLGEAGRQRVRELYHWDRLGERLMEIYQPILRSEPDN
jgi:glycosyltransferase involved in cell wall biosynthesis